MSLGSGRIRMVNQHRSSTSIQRNVTHGEGDSTAHKDAISECERAIQRIMYTKQCRLGHLIGAFGSSVSLTDRFRRDDSTTKPALSLRHLFLLRGSPVSSCIDRGISICPGSA